MERKCKQQIEFPKVHVGVSSHKTLRQDEHCKVPANVFIRPFYFYFFLGEIRPEETTVWDSGPVLTPGGWWRPREHQRKK